MSNIIQLRRLLKAMPGLIEPAKNYAWTGASDKQAFAFLQRAVVVRQWESLHAILELENTGHGHFGVTFLRPAYEELIWLEYLLSVPDEADRIVFLMGCRGVTKSVNRQAEYLGLDVMQYIGWDKTSLAKHRHAMIVYNAQLKDIGKRLGWPRTPPTFKWISAKVGRETEYDFLYHATSNFVHFSPHELLRRVWGQYGKVSIKSSNFTRYWEDFAAYWSIHTFVQVVVAVGDLLASDNAECDEIVLEIIKDLAPVPIVTPSELEPWQELPSSD